MQGDQEGRPGFKGNPDHASGTILGDARFRYCPLWEVRASGVFCYLCEPFWDVGTGELVPEDALPSEFGDPRRVAALDLATLRTAIAQAEEVAERYAVLTVLIPVHYATLADDATYTAACNTAVWPVLDSVYFEIIKPPAEASQGQLSRVTDAVKPFGAGVLLRVEAGFDRFGEIPADGVLSVGMDLRADRRDEPDVIADLRRFASEARSRELQSHVHGLTTVTLGMAAANAGFDFVGGDAIAPPLEKWEPETEGAPPIDLFKTLLAAAKAGRGGG